MMHWDVQRAASTQQTVLQKDHPGQLSKLLLQILCFWDRVPLCYLQLTIFLLKALIVKAKLKVYSVTIYKQNYTSITVDWYYEQ